MFNKHLFKTLFFFTLIIGLGMVSFALINHYQQSGNVQQATPARP